jgi:TonB family protein
VVSGRPTVALYAVDTSGTSGTVLEFTEPELRDVLTSIWSVASERDSTLLAPEVLDGDTVWTEHTVDRWAHPRQTKDFPHFPNGLIEKGVEGSVVLSFVVDTSGAVIAPTIEVLDASRPAFRDVVVDFVRRLTFEPAEVDGRKVRSRYLLPFGFAIGRSPRLERFDVLLIADRTPPWMLSP